jgi:hypothetical protein
MKHVSAFEACGIMVWIARHVSAFEADGIMAYEACLIF